MWFYTFILFNKIFFYEPFFLNTNYQWIFIHLLACSYFTFNLYLTLYLARNMVSDSNKGSNNTFDFESKAYLERTSMIQIMFNSYLPVSWSPNKSIRESIRFLHVFPSLGIRWYCDVSVAESSSDLSWMCRVNWFTVNTTQLCWIEIFLKSRANLSIILIRYSRENPEINLNGAATLSITISFGIYQIK